MPYKVNACKALQCLGLMAGEIYMPDDFGDIEADDIVALFGALE